MNSISFIMDPREQQNQNPASYDPNRPISAVLNQEKQGFTPSTPEPIKVTTAHQSHPASIVKTYESDVATSIKEQQESLARMALAEQRRREKEAELQEEMVPRNKRILFAVISALCIFLGIGALLAVYMFLQIKNAPVAIETPQAIVASDTQMVVDITSGVYEDALQEALQTPHSENTINSIVFQYTAPDPQKEMATSTFSVSATEFLQYLLPNTPDALTRAFDGSYILGTLGGATPKPFLVLSTSNYNQVFGGMFSWEKSLFASFENIFSLPTQTPRIGFIDFIFQNRDLRVLVDENSTIILLYGFFDTKTLVITTSLEAYQELYTRFIAGQLR